MEFTPHSAKQELAISSEKPIVMLGTGIQFGKGIPESFPVLGPCGYRPAKDIVVGDCLIDRDGQPTTVNGVFPQGDQDCYEIHFSDRKSIKTDGSHRNVIQRRSGRPECVMSTKELYESPFLWGKAQVPAAKPFNLPYNHHVLSPYIIGALLGDGCLGQGVNISNPDEEILHRITEELPENLILKHRENCDWSIVERERQHDAGGHGYSLAHDEIRRLGLYGCKSDTKFIPDEYKFDSIDNRKDLLRGLMDTDGTVEQNKKMEYYTVSKRLAEDVIWLAESLGGKAWWTEKPEPKYTYKGEKRIGQLCYRLNLIMPHYNPFYLSRKAERYFVHENTPNKIIKEVRKVGKAKTICFSVDSPTETFIIGNQVVTHNTKAGVITTAEAIGKYTAADDNFLVTAPTYKILQQSTLPEFLRILDGFGEMLKGEMVFKVHGGGTVYFRTGTDPDSVVGITNVRHVHADEAGLYSLYFWENIQARASFREAQIVLTTSPYALNWVYKELIRPKQRDPNARPDVELIQARSDENPFFPRKEFERKKASMDPRRFRMIYGGEWGRMEGLVYDCFDEHENICEPFTLPAGTTFVGGIDWGYTHKFSLVVFGVTESGMFYQVSETARRGLTLPEIIEICRQKKSVWGIDRFYADPSQPGYIEEFNRNKLPCIPANNDIRLGIEYVYELLKERRYKIFAGSSPYTINEMETYHWPEDKDLKPDQDDKERNPVKQDDDVVDSIRYLIAMTYKTGAGKYTPKVIDDGAEVQEDRWQRTARLKRLPNRQRSENWT